MMDSKTRAIERLRALQEDAYRADGTPIPDAPESCELLVDHYLNTHRASPVELFDALLPFITRSLESKGAEPDLVGSVVTSMRSKFASASPEALRSFLIAWLTRGDLPSPLESPVHYFSLLSVSSRIESYLVHAGVAVTPSKLFGTVPSGDVNAMIFLDRESAYHIFLVDRGFFTFFARVCDILASAMDRTNDGSAIVMTKSSAPPSSLTETPQPLHDLFGALLAHVVIGDARAGRSRITLDPLGAMLSRAFLESVLVFMICHEYGHLVLGHLENSSARDPSVWEGQTARLMLNRERELAADRYAIELSRQVGLGGLIVPAATGIKPASMALVGAEVMLHAAELVNRSIAILRLGKSGALLSPLAHPRYSEDQHAAWFTAACMSVFSGASRMTHPDPLDRRATIYDAFQRDHGEELAAEAFLVHSMLELMWSRLVPALVQMHEQGHRPAQQWGTLPIGGSDLSQVVSDAASIPHDDAPSHDQGSERLGGG